MLEDNFLGLRLLNVYAGIVEGLASQLHHLHEPEEKTGTTRIKLLGQILTVK